MKKFLLSMVAALPMVASAGWFDTASESYLEASRHVGGGVYECQYRTNPGNRGMQRFTIRTQGGCYRFVLYNARTGQVSLPR